MNHWIYRYREGGATGRVNKKKLVETVNQFPTKIAAEREVEGLRLAVNAKNAAVPVTVEQLVKHYEQKELPNKAFSTQRTWRGCAKTHILPEWGGLRFHEVKTVDVETWLRGLSLANATKAKLRNTMHVVFAHACRYDWLIKKPITLVRQSAKRQKTPDVFTSDEIKLLLAELENPAHLLVFLTAATGLRVFEAMGLKWADVDPAAGELRLVRAIVHQHLGDMKTETSQKPVPMAGALAAEFREWRNITVYSGSEDWIFASPKMKGKQPYWPETLMKCFVRPALNRLGITKRIGWHTFRRTLATLLRSTADDVKTAQELMRHANSRPTLDVYAQGLMPAKRSAHQKVVEMIWAAKKVEVVPAVVPALERQCP
jgi:integrase